MNNFDLKRFLTENKLTTVSKLTEGEKMDNVKVFLQKLKGEMDNQMSSSTTHWSEEQFEDMAEVISGLQTAIEKDLAN